jgi:hypothetical protein
VYFASRFDGDPVLVLEALLEHFELEKTDGAEIGVLAAATRKEEELDDAFLGELLEAAVEGLALHRVLEAHGDEVLRGEAGDAGELQRSGVRKSVPHAELSGVVEADDVPGQASSTRSARPRERVGFESAAPLPSGR